MSELKHEFDDVTIAGAGFVKCFKDGETIMEIHNDDGSYQSYKKKDVKAMAEYFGLIDEWISVNDRLPEKDSRIIVYSKSEISITHLFGFISDQPIFTGVCELLFSLR